MQESTEFTAEAEHDRSMAMPTPDMIRMRVRFTGEIECRLPSRGEADRAGRDPGRWAGFSENDIRDALEEVLRWPALSLGAGPDVGVDQRSKWSSTDVIDVDLER